MSNPLYRPILKPEPKPRKSLESIVFLALIGALGVGIFFAKRETAKLRSDLARLAQGGGTPATAPVTSTTELSLHAEALDISKPLTLNSEPAVLADAAPATPLSEPEVPTFEAPVAEEPEASALVELSALANQAELPEMPGLPELSAENSQEIVAKSDDHWALSEESWSEDLSTPLSELALPAELLPLSPLAGIRFNRGPKHRLAFPDADLSRQFAVMPNDGKMILDHDTRLALTYSVGGGLNLKPFEFRGKAFINQYQVGVIQLFLN